MSRIPGGVGQPLDEHNADPAIAGPDCARYVAHAERALREFGRRSRSTRPTSTTTSPCCCPVARPDGRPAHRPRPRPALTAADATGTLIGAVCHGPAGLLSAVDANGTWLFAGREMTASTDEEEQPFGTADGTPWSLASRLRDLDAKHSGGPAYQPFTVRDGNLLTGQNPASSSRWPRP